MQVLIQRPGVFGGFDFENPAHKTVWIDIFQENNFKVDLLLLKYMEAVLFLVCLEKFSEDPNIHFFLKLSVSVDFCENVNSWNDKIRRKFV